jgi:hypothetical protein
MRKDIYKKIVAFLGSKAFLWLIIAFFIIESAWIAVSFRYPMVYDETFHVPVIQIFGHQWSPFITNQLTSYYGLQDLRHQSLLYHYLMSFPYRVVVHLTDSFFRQVVFLRLINILFAAGGLIIFWHLLKMSKIRTTYINTGLLLFVLLPIVPFVAATINYDNMLFILTAWYVLLSVKVLQQRELSWPSLAGLISVGCFASLTKFTFLPLFTASVIFLTIVLWRRHGVRLPKLIGQSFLEASRRWRIISSIGLVIFIGLFSAVYLQNAVRYGSLQPSCGQTLNKQRCMSSYVYSRNVSILATRDERATVALSRYADQWVQNMQYGAVISAANTVPNNKLVATEAPPIMVNFIFFGSVVGVAVLLYGWRQLSKNLSWYYLIFMIAILFLSVFAVNVLGYYKNHAALANQSRYLLSLLPVLLVMIVAAASVSLRIRWLKMGVLAIVLALLSQGGGVITHIVRSNDSWYWQNPKIIEVNHAAKNVLDPLVKQNYGKYGL